MHGLEQIYFFQVWMHSCINEIWHLKISLVFDRFDASQFVADHMQLLMDLFTGDLSTQINGSEAIGTKTVSETPCST